MKYFDKNTLNFILYDTLKLEKIFDFPRYQDHDKENTDIFLNAIHDLADKSCYPFFREMDENPVAFEDGKIKAHPQIGVLMRKGGEMGLLNGNFDYEEGGLQIPHTVHTAAYYILEAANNHITGYLGLTNGAAELIATFGNEEVKEKFTPKMMAGEWGGTMCLTEPQAGSSLSDIVTSARPLEDGTYRIKGQKIFISGGDYPHVDNIVHLVLARIDGAPSGTKGISLFAVPKKRKAASGELEPNDVITAGDFQKMGQRGYATTHLFFGEKDDCHAWLIGEPHRGLSYMFLMMNGARIAVGRGGAAIASAAYYASLQYANERAQGRALNNSGAKDVAKEQTLIINHADVRRMLFLQKAISEGALSLVLQTAIYYDIHEASESKEEKQKYKLLLELLTPIVKTYPAEMGKISVDAGLQVLGGYGFCTEYILQQYYRDIRIFSIYEGTTGIQSKDLLGRKIMMANGQGAQYLAQEVSKTMQEAMAYEELQPYAKTLGEKLHKSTQVIVHLGGFAQKGDYETFLADANLFMEFFSTIVVAWQWLRMATEAKNALKNGTKTYPEEFYRSKIHTMKFYFKYEVPKTESLANILMDTEVLTLAGMIDIE